jgi:hypothetical protein
MAKLGLLAKAKALPPAKRCWLDHIPADVRKEMDETIAAFKGGQLDAQFSSTRKLAEFIVAECKIKVRPKTVSDYITGAANGTASR